MRRIHIINDSFAYNTTAEYICQADDGADDDDDDNDDDEEEEEELDTSGNDHDNYNSVIIISIIK